MAGADLDDWYALLTAGTSDIRRSREISARLAVLNDTAILFGVASQMIRHNPRFRWYLEPVCDRLPAAELRELAGHAVRARENGANGVADDVIAYVSVHQPQALTAHLRSLWDTRPNSSSYYSTWPWRAADSAEVARLLEIARHPARVDADLAIRCLLQTRRPDVLAQLPAERHYLAMVGYGHDGDGVLKRLYTTAVWHLAFPRTVLDEWATTRPLRAQQSSWPVYSDTGRQHLVSGFADQACPKCGHRLHRLLRLDPVPAALGITCRDRVEFIWCPVCTGFTDAWYARHGPDGTPADFTVSPDAPPTGDLESPEDWFIPETPVALVQLHERWRQQDWALSNDRENLHRVGREPTWIQNADYPDCLHCSQTMNAAAQIAVADLWNGEGICYLMWCDECAVSAVIYLQT